MLGERRIVSKGLRNDIWRDLYHYSMTVTWPVFILGVAALFFVLNALFALAFWFGHEPIANAPPGSFLHLFYFSIETLATVGYGDMHPQSHYGHIVASLEMFAGLIFAAVITGLIFARFSRPRARLLFADVVTVSQHEGRRTLSLRVANARLNLIGNASARLWLVRTEVTAEGKTFRRFRDMALVRQENPIFALSWSIFHIIDESSLLWGLTSQDLEASDASFILAIQGRDESFSQDVIARCSYSWKDVRWNASFADIIETNENQRLVINYNVFNDVRPEPDPRDQRPA